MSTPSSQTESEVQKGTSAVNIRKLGKLITQMRKILNYPMLQEKDMNALATISRQIKLYLNVNVDLRRELLHSDHMNILMTLPRKCMKWTNIVSDILVSIHMSVLQDPIDPNIKDALWRSGLTEVCLAMFKRFDQMSDSTRLAVLEIQQTICQHVVQQKDIKAKPPPGRDIVYDGSAVLQNTLHFFIKNGAITVLPQIVLEYYYEDLNCSGAMIVQELLLLTLQNSVASHLSDLCKCIDKDFVSAMAVHLYRVHKEQMNAATLMDPTDDRSTSNDMLIQLLAGMIACNDDIAKAMAKDSRKWNVISKLIENNYALFEGSTMLVLWYRGAFERVNEASQDLFNEDSSNSSIMYSPSSKLYSRTNTHKTGYWSQNSSPIQDQNRSAVLLQSKSTIISFDNVDDGCIDSPTDRSFVDRSFVEETIRPGSSVKYALDLMASEKDPLRIDIDETATSQVLHRLKTGPYSGGKFQSRHDMPEAYKSPRKKQNSSPKAGGQTKVPQDEISADNISELYADTNADIYEDVTEILEEDPVLNAIDEKEILNTTEEEYTAEEEVEETIMDVDNTEQNDRYIDAESDTSMNSNPTEPDTSMNSNPTTIETETVAVEEVTEPSCITEENAKLCNFETLEQEDDKAYPSETTQIVETKEDHTSDKVPSSVQSNDIGTDEVKNESPKYLASDIQLSDSEAASYEDPQPLLDDDKPVDTTSPQHDNSNSPGNCCTIM